MRSSEEDKLRDLIQLLEQRKSTNSQDSLFIQSFSNKSPDEIKNFLAEELSQFKIADKLMEDAKDDGGIIAISGFYFQFLVTIEYLIELLDGKWDYILIDHHQDIVVFNKETIRLIQVKTKNLEHCNVSETDLYRSWLPKLFESDQIFNGFSQKREFELVTNFVPLNTKNIKVEHFKHNDSFEMASEDKSFFNKVKKYTIDEGLKLSITEEELGLLLQRFKFTVKGSDDYLHKIKAAVGGIFDGNFNAIEEDLYSLVGFICSRCYYPDSHVSQLIDKEMGLEIKDNLEPLIYSRVKNAVDKRDSIKYIDKYINALREKFKNTKYDDDFTLLLTKFEDEIKQQVNTGQNIFSILSKYIDKVNSSAFINEASAYNIEKWLTELLDLIFMLKYIFDCNIEIDSENKRLLIKNISDEKYNLFNLKDTENLNIGRENFSEVIKAINPEERASLYSNKVLNVILTGDYRKRGFEKGFLEENIVELDFSSSPKVDDLKVNSLQEITQPGETYSRVTFKTRFINGHQEIIKEIQREREDFETLEDYIKYSKVIFIGDLI